MAVTEDAFRFVYQKMKDDVSVKVLVLSQDITNKNIKAGLMFRSSLDDNAKHVSAFTSNQSGFSVEHTNRK